MDEIDRIKKAKKVLKVFAKIAVGTSIFFIVLSIISFMRGNYKGTEWIVMGTFLAASFLPLIIVCLGYIIISIIEKIMHSGRTVINFDQEYIRDLPKHCSPALTSFIYDLKIDAYKDYTATILYLSLKHYIKFVPSGPTYRIEVSSNKDYSQLSQCEQYVLNIILGRSLFNENEFKQNIVQEAKEKGLITNKKLSKVPKMILIIFIEILLLILTYKINFILFAFYTSISLTAGCAYFYMKNMVEYVQYKRTKDGKDLALLFKGLKKYIHEYTLIKDKGIDYIQVLEAYIPYALCLDEAQAVEDYVRHNDEYRDLIYNRK